MLENLGRTYPGSLPLLSHDCDAFDNGGPGVVDAIKHRLVSIGISTKPNPPLHFVGFTFN